MPWRLGLLLDPALDSGKSAAAGRAVGARRAWELNDADKAERLLRNLARRMVETVGSNPGTGSPTKSQQQSTQLRSFWWPFAS
jgi:hypothetical protein